jgi:hypothetical protein
MPSWLRFYLGETRRQAIAQALPAHPGRPLGLADLGEPVDDLGQRDQIRSAMHCPTMRSSTADTRRGPALSPTQDQDPGPVRHRRAGATNRRSRPQRSANCCPSALIHRDLGPRPPPRPSPPATGRTATGPQQPRALAQAQDVERAADHGLARFTGYITLTVTDPSDIDDACAELEADAASARIELRRMWLTQDAGFACSALPLGFGLPRRRW